MGAYKPHRIWIEQCEAARSIRVEFGVEAAFDYLVAEKLLHFAEAAARHAEFARELPSFLSEVRLIFGPSEIRNGIARKESQLRDEAAYIPEDDSFTESPKTLAERAKQFEVIKELLTAPALGTS